MSEIWCSINSNRLPPHHLHAHAALPKSVDWFLILYLGFHPSGGDGLLFLQHNITGRQWLIYNSIWTKYPRWNSIAHTTTVNTQLSTSHFSLSIPSAVLLFHVVAFRELDKHYNLLSSCDICLFAEMHPQVNEIRPVPEFPGASVRYQLILVSMNFQCDA